VALQELGSARLVRIEIPIVDANKRYYYNYVQLNAKGKDVAMVDITDYWGKYPLANKPLNISYLPTDTIVQSAGILPGEGFTFLAFQIHCTMKKIPIRY